MTARGSALLVVVLVLLAAYLWRGELHRRTAAPPPETPALLSVPAGRITRLELEEGPRHLAALRRDGGWVDDAGRPWNADPVASLLATLGSLRPVMVVEADAARAGEYGFDGETAVLRCVDDAGRSALDLELGAPNPSGTAIYARLAGRHEVVLVGGLLRWELEKLRRAAPGTQP